MLTPRESSAPLLLMQEPLAGPCLVLILFRTSAHSFHPPVSLRVPESLLEVL